MYNSSIDLQGDLFALVSSSEVLNDAAQKVERKEGLLGGMSGRAPRGPVRGMRLAECHIWLILIWVFHCLRDYVWADGNWADLAYHFGKIVEL